MDDSQDQNLTQLCESQVTNTQKWLVFMAMCAAIFIIAFATTAITNAMVPIRLQMNLDATQLQWTTNAYILAAATLMVLGGLLSDRYGRRTMNVIGGLIFVLGSVVCGMATVGAEFIMGRFVQGVGVAIIMPGTLALMKVTFPEDQQGIVTSGWAAAIGLGMGLGPFLSGVFCETVGWEYLFALIGVIMLLAIILLVIAEHQRVPINKEVTIDFWGLLVFLCGFALFVYAFIEGNSMGWDNPLIISFLVVGVVTMCLQPWVERHVHKTPFINFDYFKRPRFSMGCLGMFICGYVLIDILFFGNLYLQNPLLLNYSAYEAGLAVIPMGLGLTLAVFIVEKLYAKIGITNCIQLSMVLLILGTIWFVCLSANSRYSVVWEPFLLIGVGCGMGIKAFPAMAIQALSAQEAARSSSIVSSFIYIGVILATSIGTILAIRLGRRIFLSMTHHITIPMFTKLRIENTVIGHPHAINHILRSVPHSLRHVLTNAARVSGLKAFHYAMLSSLVFLVITMIVTNILLKMKEYHPPAS